MKVCVLNGNPDASLVDFDAHLAELEQHAVGRGHLVKTLTLRDLDIRYCIGCFGCWVKTPGECIAKDDSSEVCRTVLHADLLLCASPVKMGHISALMKKVHDKLLPLLLPYFTVRNGESHHPLRYGRMPDIALLLDRCDADDEDIAIIERSYRRLAINFDSEFKFLKLNDASLEEVVDAIGTV